MQVQDLVHLARKLMPIPAAGCALQLGHLSGIFAMLTSLLSKD